ncbi:Endonuclease/exonuclease/phosphatase [Limtongia smithiae]|uniref:Endonuclease/exonuclease/phosphatase n=1 Tax=Limtongia smithiae TaxID=1125753 RepID=UPI0034CEB360
MSSLVLTTSSHVLTFHPASRADSGGTVDTPFYTLQTKASADVEAHESMSNPTVTSQLPLPSSSRTVLVTPSADLTVHDSIGIEEDRENSDNFRLIFQGQDLGTYPKSGGSTLAEFVLAWRTALAALEELVPVSQVSKFQDPLHSDYVTTRLIQERDSFIEEKCLRIRCVTWNVHGEIIGEDLKPLLFGSLDGSADNSDTLGMYFVGLQEADPLSPTTMSAKRETIERWTSNVLEVLGDSHMTIASCDLIGMVLLFFSHKKIASQISNIQVATAGTGVFGLWGNKGAVSIRFKLGANDMTGSEGVDIAVLNMHLSSGNSMQSLERRRWEMSEFERRIPLPRYNGKLYRKSRNGGQSRTELLFQNGDLLKELDERGLDSPEDSEDVLSAYPDLDISSDSVTDAMAKTDLSDLVLSQDDDSTATDKQTSDSQAYSENGTTTTTSSIAATTAATVNSDLVGLDGEMDSIVFVFGDLNYRISMDRKDLEQLVNKADYNGVLAWDQLRREIKEESVLFGFQEGCISFPPSYKYDIGTSTFDTSEKARIPAYTDRVFFTPYPSLSLLDYESFMHYISSDHKPVAASFELRIPLIDVDKRAEIVKRLMRDLDARENESRPKVEVERTELVCTDLKPLSTVTQVLKFKNYGNTQVVWEIEPMENLTLRFSEMSSIVSPGAAHSVRITFVVPVHTSAFSEIFILRIVNRQDYFISVVGNVLPSCFGASLDSMIDRPSGARNGIVKLSPDGLRQVNIPLEIGKCIEYLEGRLTTDIFQRKGDAVVGALIRDWLDNGSQFDVQVLDSLDSLKGVHSVAEQFLLLLELIDGGVIPTEAYSCVIKGADGVNQIFEAMPRVNINTFIYVASFLREVRLKVIDFDYILQIFDKVLVRIPEGARNKSKQIKKRIEFFKVFIG